MTLRRCFAWAVLIGAFSGFGASIADAGVFHYPWCETIRARCFSSPAHRKAECNWRYDYARKHVVNGLSKWPSGVSNYCFLYPADGKS